MLNYYFLFRFMSKFKRRQYYCIAQHTPHTGMEWSRIQQNKNGNRRKVNILRDMAQIHPHKSYHGCVCIQSADEQQQ